MPGLCGMRSQLAPTEFPPRAGGIRQIGQTWHRGWLDSWVCVGPKNRLKTLDSSSLNGFTAARRRWGSSARKGESLFGEGDPAAVSHNTNVSFVSTRATFSRRRRVARTFLTPDLC